MRTRLGVAVLWGSLAMGCGGGAGAGSQPAVPVSPQVTPGPAAGSSASGSAAGTASDPFVLPSGPRDDSPVTPEAGSLRLDAWAKASHVKGLAPIPSSCAAYVKRAGAPLTPTELAPVAPLSSADRADQAAKLLRQPPATVRAVVADFAPAECGDSVVDGDLTKASQQTGRIGHAVVGLSLAGKLARTADALPKMGAATDKAKLKAFIQGPLKAWLVEQATAIETLSAGAAELTGYGRGIAAIEAGSADLRLVDKMRAAPVPSTWDAELKGVYEAALDEALEPRKKRGRDAALVGLADFAQAGVLGDPRVERARTLLSKLYGGRRIDALDGLMLPPHERPADDRGARAPIAVTPFWPDVDPAFAKPSAAVDPKGALEDPKSAQTLFARGVSESFRARARSLDAWPSSELRSSYARARFDLGRLYWRRVDFVEAAYAAKAGTTPEDRLVLALSLALAHGPKSAREMMGAAPEALDLGHTEALDALVVEGGPLAGLAAFDAAHLRSLMPPTATVGDGGTSGNAAASHFRDVAARFKKAETLLTDTASKKRAADRAAEAEALAAAAEGSLKH